MPHKTETEVTLTFKDGRKNVFYLNGMWGQPQLDYLLSHYDVLMDEVSLDPICVASIEGVMFSTMED